MTKVAIVGFGRFGKTLYRLLRDDFAISIYNRSTITSTGMLEKNTRIVDKIPDIYESDVIFYCIPISAFGEVIRSHKKYFLDRHLLIDVLSVKTYPKKILNTYLRGMKTQALLTHPMFGPDSSKESFSGLPIVLDRFKSDKKNYTFWSNFFAKKGLTIVELSAQKHDKMAANSQGITHFIGRLLEQFHFKNTPIDTLGAKNLHKVMEQTCNDTWELFLDLQNYNPHTKHMRIKLGKAYNILFNKLIPIRANPNLIIGIQGGKGSFNDEAIHYYLKNTGLSKIRIKYLYTTEKVLKALQEGEIDRGQFAIHNSIGGVVQESIEAIAKHKFTILHEFKIKVSHALMIRKDAKFSDIDTIMTHPQVFIQCKQTLDKKYTKLTKIVGKGKLIDPAFIAKRLSEKNLGKNVATIGRKTISDIYGLTIIDNNLQDVAENYTSFIVVKR